MAQYPSTTNYEMFELLEFNRDVEKTRELEKSMRNHGYIPAYPLHVVKRGKKLLVKGGHHRLTVASKLGIPVFYAVCDDDASVHDLEKTVVDWTLKDYLTSFVRLNRINYIKLQEYQLRTKINLSACIAMLGGQCASGTGNLVRAFKDGEFVIKDTTHADAVADVVFSLKKAGIKWATDTLLVQTISRIVIAGHADLDQLKNKIKAHKSLIEKQPNVQAYTEMFEDIYNRGVRGPRTPLSFLTNETLRQRQQNFGKGK